MKIDLWAALTSFLFEGIYPLNWEKVHDPIQTFKKEIGVCIIHKLADKTLSKHGQDTNAVARTSGVPSHLKRILNVPY